MGVIVNVHEKIRKLREIKLWSQEEMAEKMNMSLNGYAKIERGETKLHLDKLEQIAHVLGIDIIELINSGERNIFFQFNENANFGSSSQNDNEKSLLIELDKLKLSLLHCQQLFSEKEALLNQLLEQKSNEIKLLRDMVELLKQS